MNEGERVERLEEQVKKLAAVVGRLLYEVTIRGNVPFDTNNELVARLNEIIPDHNTEDTGERT